jgi:hypothetical protein
MFIGPGSGQPSRDYRHVIVGAGFAGLFLAEKLAACGPVLVIEAGPLDNPLAMGEGYYEIATSALSYPPLGSRLSSFGGTSNHWTGQGRPFSPEIFRNRPELGIAGWPIDYADYEAHLPEALEWLNYKQPFDRARPISQERGLLAGIAGVAADRFQRSEPLLRLGDPAMRSRFAAHPDIDVLTDTRVIDIKLADGGSRVASLELVDRTGTHRLMPVENVILCCSGTENPRLMLWAGRNLPRGNPLNGGPNELTGRFFTEHPVLFPVELYFDQRIDLSDAHEFPGDAGAKFFIWRLSDVEFERQQLLRFGVLFLDDGLLTPLSLPNRGDAHYLGQSAGYRLTVPAFKFEQSPTLESRISLSERRDRDGTALANMHWVISESDLANYRRGVMRFCALLGQRGFVRARLRPDYRGDVWTQVEPARSAHHMGATRMAHSASAGVVDTDGKVFGLDNLYVAGASVFPNGGDSVNPTLSIITLCARMAHRLSAGVAPRPRQFQFGTSGQDNGLLVEGWSFPEQRGIWTEGHRARVVVPTQGARHIRIFAEAYRKARVRVLVNGDQRFTGTARDARRFETDLDPKPETEIVFEFDEAYSPHELGESDDRRVLGIFLRWMEVTP